MNDSIKPTGAKLHSVPTDRVNERGTDAPFHLPQHSLLPGLRKAARNPRRDDSPPQSPPLLRTPVVDPLGKDTSWNRTVTAASVLHALPAATESRSSVAPAALLGRFWGPSRGAPSCARARVRRRRGPSAARWRPERLQRAKFPPQVARRDVPASELAGPRLA